MKKISHTKGGFKNSDFVVWKVTDPLKSYK